VDLNTGNLMYYTLDSLSAFWPGLQVLAGDIENAIKSHMFFWNLWQQYSGLPEVWDINYKTATSNAFPLRPGACIVSVRDIHLTFNRRVC
jgi:mannosidase alpha-like ER degradation enhancer 1